VRSYGEASAIFANKKKAKNHTQNVEKVLLASRANYLDLVLLKKIDQIQIQIFGFGIWL
jgi:hypothetical protein